jgi:hypothetical protein
MLEIQAEMVKIVFRSTDGRIFLAYYKVSLLKIVTARHLLREISSVSLRRQNEA